jgi:hypothetical protein
MTNSAADNGVSLEVLGQCTTNTTQGSQHDAKVEYRHLWSFAQQAALIAVSDKSLSDGCYRLIQDPERRAKRIAANYADLYFKSAEKSKGQLQFYWPALAAFVVKDIVEAYRFSREEVLQREWNSAASIARNNVGADIGSLAMSGDSPYQHVLRTYAALAKGNLWLFMDIHPWLWFFLEYGINADGSLNKKRIEACQAERDWDTFQIASKEAVEELPFGPHWLDRLKQRLSDDPVFKAAEKYFDSAPVWSSGEGYGQQVAAAFSAHRYCRTHVKGYDNGYRTPPSKYWGKFQEAYYIMEAEHTELKRVADDRASLAALIKCRHFAGTAAVSRAYELMVKGHSSGDREEKKSFQKLELVAIAEQEQINVLQPLIYNDAFLTATMDMNHRFSRMTGGWLSPQFKVIYSFAPANKDPSLEAVFDAPTGLRDRFKSRVKSLPNQKDRMEFVGQIARNFNRLMDERRNYMDGELRKIQGWLDA